VGLTGLRLVGPTTDEAWSTGAPAGSDGVDAPEFGAAAEWVRGQLGARHARGVSLMVLDAEGTTCAWITSETADPSVVSAMARLGAGPEAGKVAGGALEFYAPAEAESSLQPLATPEDARSGARRMPVLGGTDVAGRLLVDALDRARVQVERVGSLAHALAAAWDPGAARGPGSGLLDTPTDAGVLTGIVLVGAGEGESWRLIWAWSRGGRLMATGSQRLRAGEGVFGPEEAQRLTAEWLAWSAQLGQAPRRVVAVAASAEHLAEFGRTLGEKWPGMSVDAVVHADPLGATLRRVADAIEAGDDAPAGDPTRGLVGLSSRPGQRHRRMHRWRAGAILAGAALVGAGAWRLSAAGRASGEAASAWEARWRQVVQETYPDAAIPRAGVSPARVLADEVRRREQAMLPPDRTTQTMPVLQELETVTMVVGHPGYALEYVELDSSRAVRLVVTAATLQEAEALHESLKKIGGSYVSAWTATYAERTEGENKKIRADLRGEWDREAVKGAGGKP
jgi:hypothetical protein